MAMAPPNDELPEQDDAKISMPAVRWMRMRENLAKAHATIADLEARLRRAELADVPADVAAERGLERAKLLGEALEAAIVIVGFAVGNLHPLTVRGWPWHRLDHLAQMVISGRLPAEVIERGLAMTWETFAREARKWEEARAEGREQQLLAEENASRAATPESLAAMGIPIVPGIPEAGTALLQTPTAIPAPVLHACPKCRRNHYSETRCQYLDCGFEGTQLLAGSTGAGT